MNPKNKIDEIIFIINENIVGDDGSELKYNSFFFFIKKYNITNTNAPNKKVTIDKAFYFVIILYGFFVNTTIANII